MNWTLLMFEDSINIPLVDKKRCILASNMHQIASKMPLSGPQCLKSHQIFLWLLLGCCYLKSYGKESFLYRTNVTSPLFNHNHSSFNAAHSVSTEKG